MVNGELLMVNGEGNGRNAAPVGECGGQPTTDLVYLGHLSLAD